MLRSLRIEKYAIIESLELELESGLTTITGETGAGKSIILGALKLLLGERAASDVLRSDAERARVEAVFQSDRCPVRDWLLSGGFADESFSGEAIVRRDILAGGGSRNFINNCSATLSQLREFGAMVVDLHGQNEHTSLLLPGAQLHLLDGFGGHESELVEYRKAFALMRDREAELRALASDLGESERRKAFLEFQVDEIARASLVPGEDEALETERRRLLNSERLGSAGRLAADLLYDGMETDRPVSSLLASVSKDLSDIARLDPSRADFAQQAEELRFLSEDLAARIREYVGTIAADPERLEVVEERIQLVRSLKRKYGATIPEILAARKSCAAELAVIENRDEALVRAEAACTKACDKALAASARLSACREAAAGAFEERVEKEMRELQLPRAVFKVAVARRPRGGESSTEMFPGTGTAPSGEGSGARIRPQAAFLTATGDDVVEFLVSLNPGEEPRPLRRVASGGEVSRIMLSIKAVLAERDEIPTLVFDEIDIGVSGEAAARVAEKLFRLGGTHQVICVTHLPQIAARGSTHLAVEKKVVRGRTLASVRVVGGEERADTIARMLSGKDLDEESRRYARKLLGKSR